VYAVFFSGCLGVELPAVLGGSLFQFFCVEWLARKTVSEMTYAVFNGKLDSAICLSGEVNRYILWQSHETWSCRFS